MTLRKAQKMFISQIISSTIITLEGIDKIKTENYKKKKSLEQKRKYASGLRYITALQNFL